MASKALQQAWLEGYLAGLEAYAHWDDGVEYVGTCGTTLKHAIIRAKREYAVDECEDDHV
jgi:hypothetical protein